MIKFDEKTVFLYVQTYDIAEPYIRRMLESIKTQTYQNFICFIYDNCSKKVSVHEIIEEYAKYDERFVLRKVFSNEGKVVGWDYGIPEIVSIANGKGYFTLVDADDELESDALETLVTAIEGLDVDLVCGGARFYDGESGEPLGIRACEEEFVVEGDGFGERFPVYHQLMRTHWPKLLKMSLLEKMKIRNLPRVPYGKDTLLMREAMLRSRRVAFIPTVVYRYYMFNTTKTYDVEKGRLESPRRLYQNDLHFLIYKVGHISQENEAFLLKVYMYETQDILKQIIKEDKKIEDKIDEIHSLLMDDTNRMIAEMTNGKSYIEFCVWLTNQMFMVNDDALIKVAEVLALIGVIPSDLAFYNADVLFKLLAEIDKCFPKGALKSVVEDKIRQICVQNKICENFGVHFLVKYSNLIFEILKGNYRVALDMVLDNISTPFGYMETAKEELIYLGLTLSALLESENEYVKVKKYEIRHLLEENPTMARKELEEWSSILPEDSDINKMIEQLEKK